MGRNPCKCERCKELFDTDLLLLDDDTKHQLPVSCKACPYTICFKCFDEWLAKDQEGLVQCPDCDTIDGFNAEEPSINRFACLVMSPEGVAARSAVAAGARSTAAKTLKASVKSERKVAAVTPITLKTKKRTSDDDMEGGKALDYDDDDQKPAPKKRRVKKKKTKFHISEDELELLENHVIVGDDENSGIEKYLRQVEKNSKGEVGLSDKNVKSIMKQVKKLESGKGIEYKNWPRNAKFLKGEEVHLGMDFEDMLEAAKDWEDTYGEDKGHGWILKHPIKKLANYQGWVLENEIRGKKVESDETEEEERVTTK